jgi:hypothetical protein
MRVYGRIPNGSGGLTWVVVSTASDGTNDLVYVTALCQCLLLNLYESPFYAQNGIPANQSVIQQVYPDYYVALTQQAFSPYFAALQISRQASITPTYQVSVTTHQGVQINANIAVPI